MPHAHRRQARKARSTHGARETARIRASRVYRKRNAIDVRWCSRGRIFALVHRAVSAVGRSGSLSCAYVIRAIDFRLAHRKNATTRSISDWCNPPVETTNGFRVLCVRAAQGKWDQHK